MARLDDPTKQWKFAASDLEARKQWDAYQAAYSQHDPGHRHRLGPVDGGAG
jgi:polyphosphate kinase 2 (PPK2 family)